MEIISISSIIYQNRNTLPAPAGAGSVQLSGNLPVFLTNFVSGRATTFLACPVRDLFTIYFAKENSCILT